jgi:hypothetical protein
VRLRVLLQYLGLYDGLEKPVAFERVNDRWEVGVAVSDGSFQQVRRVCALCTSIPSLKESAYICIGI